MDKKTLKNYREFMQTLGFCAPPLVSHYSDQLPVEYISPEGGFAIEIKSARDLLSYAGNPDKLNEKRKQFRCMFQYLSRTRENGVASVFDYDNFGCPGARFYMGFIEKLPRFNHYFTSTGFPVIYKGERLSQSVQSAEKHAALLEGIKPRGKYLVFDRIDKLALDLVPDTVVFFANPEIIAALVALVRFVTDEMDGVQSPFTSGCASIFSLAFRSHAEGIKKGILGVFDPAARAYLHAGEMTLSLPYRLFADMLQMYKKSFLHSSDKEHYLVKNAVPGWQNMRSRAGELYNSRQ